MYTCIHVCIEFRKFHYDDQPRIAKSAWVLLYLICRTDYLQCHTNNPCLERSGSRTFCGAGRLRKKLTPKSTDPWVVLAKKKGPIFQPVPAEWSTKKLGRSCGQQLRYQIHGDDWSPQPWFVCSSHDKKNSHRSYIFRKGEVNTCISKRCFYHIFDIFKKRWFHKWP